MMALPESVNMKGHDMSKQLKVGDRVMLTADYDIYPLGIWNAGETGTLCGIRDNLNGESGYSYMVKLDNTYAALNEWDNQLQVDDREGSDIPPLARIDTFDSMCAEYRALDPEA